MPRRLLVGLTALLTGLAGLVPSTESALVAKVTNSVNTAASNPFFTCKAAVTSTSLPTQNYIYNSTSVTNPTTFTGGVWFKTGATIGGRLIGFGSSQIGTSGQYDGHLYLTNAGQLIFGVCPNAYTTAASPLSYGDGLWHQAVTTLSSAGMALYVDGALVASDPNTGAQSYTGYWRVGYDSLNTWANQPSDYNFRGSLAWAKVYTVALTALQVKQQYVAGT